MYRGRRLRKGDVVRSLLRETHLQKADFILPIFVVEGEGLYEAIKTMPDVYRYSIDKLFLILDEMTQLGISACMLFGIPAHKDAIGSEAYQDDGIVQRAIRYIKQAYPNIYIIGDVCMCEYTDHGHCGLLNEAHDVDNDATLVQLGRIAHSYALAGVDMVAPSAMMDGQIHAIRETLDQHGYQELPIMGYSAKFVSNFYGPFREAANSTPCFGNRKSYQMDGANGNEAMCELQADMLEGADILMVKPAMAYLDIVSCAKQRFDVPLATYHVSGEYAMLKRAIQEGLLHEDAILESMISMKRAGASLIITYFACDVARRMDEGGHA